MGVIQKLPKTVLTFSIRLPDNSRQPNDHNPTLPSNEMQCLLSVLWCHSIFAEYLYTAVQSWNIFFLWGVLPLHFTASAFPFLYPQPSLPDAWCS